MKPSLFQWKMSLVAVATAIICCGGAPTAYAAIVYQQTSDLSGSQVIPTAVLFPCTSMAPYIGSWVNDGTSHALDGGNAQFLIKNIDTSSHTVGIRISEDPTLSSCDSSAEGPTASVLVPANTSGFVASFTTLTGGFIATSTNTYYVYLYDDDSFGSHVTVYSQASNVNGFGYVTDSGGGMIPIDASSTRIISLVPQGGSTVGTSSPTTFAVTGYIAPPDYVPGMSVVVDTGNLAQDYVLGGSALEIFNATVNASFETFTFPVTGSGYFSYSTTSTLSLLGHWLETADVITPATGFATIPIIGSFFGGVNTITSTSSTFIVATSSPHDALIAENASAVQGYILQGIVPATTTPTEQHCNVASGNFSALACVSDLVIPAPADWANMYAAVYNDFLTRFPFGYLTRFWAIVSDSSLVTEPPPITYTFGSSSPAVLQGDSVSYQIWDYVGSSSPLYAARSDDGQNKDIWEIVDPYWSVAVAFAVIMSVLVDTLGFSTDVVATMSANRMAQFDSDERRKYDMKQVYRQTITNYPMGRVKVRYDKRQKNV